jgi:hypothetical protein
VRSRLLPRQGGQLRKGVQHRLSTLVIANPAVDDGEWGAAACANTAHCAEFYTLLFEELGFPIPLKLLQHWARSFDKAGRARTNQAAVLWGSFKAKEVIKTGRSPNVAIG